MKRISDGTIDENGKSLFSLDTPVVPDWLNDVQEELCNLVESENPLEEKRTQVKEAVENKIKKAVDDILEKIKQCRAPIGSVIQTFLTEAQFLAQGYVGWVLCDGRNVDCSEYQRLGLGDTVPDCRGLFFRTQNGPNIGEIKQDTTAMNGLKIKGSTNSAFETSPNIQYKSSNTWVDFSNDNLPTPLLHTTMRVKDTADGRSLDLLLKRNEEVRWKPGKEHNHSLESSITGDNETAPKHIIINTFIKVS